MLARLKDAFHIAFPSLCCAFVAAVAGCGGSPPFSSGDGDGPARDLAVSISCPAAELACGATCADPDSDALHCGGCGQACARGEACRGGRCVSTCDGGLALCGAACVNLLNDPIHCGACAVRCGTLELCANGKCTLACPKSLSECGGACVDLTRDLGHCGDCKTVCGPGTKPWRHDKKEEDRDAAYRAAPGRSDRPW